MAAIWLTQQDLEAATSAKMVAACFDDDGNGSLNFPAIAAVIDRAEQEVMSYLVVELGPPPLSPALIAQLATDTFLKYAAVDFAVAYMFDRHPEYVRAKMQDDRARRLKSAEDRMIRILEARQRPPTVPTPPANVGGFSNDGANRLVTDSPGGPAGGNAGDYIELENDPFAELNRMRRLPRGEWDC